MDRRALIFGIAFGLATGSLAAEAQQTGKMWRIPVLTADRPGAVEALLDGLRELHYVEGQNLVLEHRRFTREEQLPTIAADLVRLSPDVIVAGSGVAALALKAATKTVPIVMAVSTDAVGQGVVASLGRPGGNITGFTDMAPDLTAKRLEILKETASQASRIAVLGCPHSFERTSGNTEWSAVQPAAQRMGLQLIPVFIRHADELPAALESAIRQRIEAVLVLECQLYSRAEDVTAVVNKARVPAIYPTTRWARGDGMMSYGPNTNDQFRRAAIFVDKILKGAKPGDLPIEQPTKFELIINLKTAKSLGLTIPPSLLLRADEVIQ